MIANRILWLLLCVPFARGFSHPSPSHRAFGANAGTRSNSVDLMRMHYAKNKKRSSGEGDVFDMDELNDRISQSDPYAILKSATSAALSTKTKALYIIAFEEQQGVHTVEYPKGSGNNVVLAFESRSAACKFAADLKEQQFFDPTVRCYCIVAASPLLIASRGSLLLTLLFSELRFCFLMQPQKVNLQFLESFCEKLGVYAQLVPKDVNVIPPQQNVKHLGHKNLREEQQELEYVFDMADGAEFEEDGILVGDATGGWD